MIGPVFPGFHGLVEQHRASFPARAALVFEGKRLTFGELFERTTRFANGMVEAGMGKGSRVLWLGQNSNVLVEAFLACARLGATLCCANWRQTAADLAFILDDFDPAIVLCEQGTMGDVIDEARALARPASRHWLSADGEDEDSYSALLGRSSPVAPEVHGDIDMARPLLVIYTAAFDGRPAGAQLSEIGLFLQALIQGGALERDRESITLVGAPLFHILAWLDLLPTLIAGGTVVIARRADPDALISLIADERISSGTIHPPTAAEMAERNADLRRDLSTFRSSLQLPGWRDMVQPGPGIGGYGQTEIAGPVVVGATAGQGSTIFCGRPAPFLQLRIVDDADVDVRTGEAGEILVRGPTVGLGYWRRPDLNRARLTEDGWWRTRDIGRRDADGTVSFIGPKLQMVKTGGENVYPAEVEAVLRAHPEVSDAAIIGTPDETWSQLVTAIIVRATDSRIDAKALEVYARERLARYKVPRIVHFAESLPRSGAALDYAALDRQFGGGNYPGQGERSAGTIGAAS